MRWAWAAGVFFLSLVLRVWAASGLELLADEAYYWTWSQHLAAGYFDHPPGVAWSIAAGTAVFGQSALAVRLPGILLHNLALAALV
ncbi:MAG: 4-amino-4-deoxy-L-arabinose transferase-like glycosyltransferase, partial [Cognaticolwellia sp.]